MAQLCRLLHIPADNIKMVMVNGKGRPMDFLLRGDERVGIFPPVGGG